MCTSPTFVLTRAVRSQQGHRQPVWAWQSWVKQLPHKHGIHGIKHKEIARAQSKLLHGKLLLSALKCCVDLRFGEQWPDVDPAIIRLLLAIPGGDFCVNSSLEHLLPEPILCFVLCFLEASHFQIAAFPVVLIISMPTKSGQIYFDKLKVDRSLSDLSVLNITNKYLKITWITLK